MPAAVHREDDKEVVALAPDIRERFGDLGNVIFTGDSETATSRRGGCGSDYWSNCKGFRFLRLPRMGLPVMPVVEERSNRDQNCQRYAENH